MEASGKHTASFMGFTAHHRLLSTFLLVWMVCASVTSVAGEWTHYCTTERSERYMAHGRCGSQLAETLSIVCRVFGGYNSRSMRKRSTAAVSGTAHAQVLGKTGTSKLRREVDKENSPFWSKSKAYSYLHIQKRVLVTRNGQTYRQGIVCECCMHKCGLGELYEYCADPAYSVSKRASTHGTSSKQRAIGDQQAVHAATGIGKRAARQSLTELLAAAGLIPQTTNETMPSSLDVHALQKALAALEAARGLEQGLGVKAEDLGASPGSMDSAKGRFGLVPTDLEEGNEAEVVLGDTQRSETRGKQVQEEGATRLQEHTLLEQLIRLHIKQHRRRQGLTGTGVTGSTGDSRDILFGK